jgi:NodT family efflux transporter outer membrane factor (OMF) lipoprotein
MIDASVTRKVASPNKPRALNTLAILVLLTGCAVGPDFKAPDPPDVSRLMPPLPAAEYPADCKAPAADVRERRRTSYCADQRLVHGLDIPGTWWTLFHSRPLSDLMGRALRDNHDLKAAQAALRVAHANYEAQRGAFFPVVNAGYFPSKQKVATRDFSAPTWSELPFFTLHTAQLTVSYVPDVFGGTRRLVEASSAQEEMQQFLLEATYLTLTSNIALAAIQEASLRKQIAYTELAISDERLFKESRLDPSNVDDASLDVGISQAQQTLPLLQKQLTAQRDMLVALSGHYAGDGLPETFDLNKMLLPPVLPVSLPSQLVEQRPDVRAAQANLHAATAGIGVAIANRLPLFNLFGNVGSMSSQFKYLFNASPQVLFWTVAGSVTQTIFDGFTLEQRQRAAEAGWDQAAEQYQTAVVTAFQNVADALQAIERDKESLRWASKAVESAAKNRCLTLAVFVKWDGISSVDLQTKPGFERKLKDWWWKYCQQAAGKPPYMAMGDDKSGSDVLTAEQLYLAAQLTFVQAVATRYSDVVALFQALGGGWWNRSDVGAADGQPLLASARAN